MELDELDRKILQMISGDARIPFLEVARACGVSGAAIHQHVAKLTGMGVIKGTEYIIDPSALGYETCAFVQIYLKEPDQFDAVVKQLNKIPEIVECHYTTGGADMFIKMYAHNNHHLMNLIHDQLQPLNLARTDTIICYNTAFDRQLPVAQ